MNQIKEKIIYYKQFIIKINSKKEHNILIKFLDKYNIKYEFIEEYPLPSYYYFNTYDNSDVYDVKYNYKLINYPDEDDFKYIGDFRNILLKMKIENLRNV